MTTKSITRYENKPVMTGSTDLTVYPSGHALSKNEVKKVGAELERQALAIYGERTKGQLGNQAIGDTRKHAAGIFTEATGHMHALVKQTHDDDQKKLVQNFVNRQCEALADNLLGISELAARNIAREVERSLYIPAEEPKRWWQRS